MDMLMFVDLDGKTSIYAYNGTVEIKPNPFQNFAFWFQKCVCFRITVVTLCPHTTVVCRCYAALLQLTIG